jgi:regulator of cell morphogenesis and NO signaling
MRREDAVLFPAIVAEAGGGGDGSGARLLAGAIDAMAQDHLLAHLALVDIRNLTNHYQPPEDACPTFRGLYYGLMELEYVMRLHAGLEDRVLFPRALALEVRPADHGRG